MGIIIAILLFSFIIIFHELGHFLLAKANGIRVDEFSLGLGPTLIGKKIGGTFFCIKLLPFGGACMMGEDDADDMSEGSFNSKSVWARMSVIAAGPLFNLLLGLVVTVVINQRFRNLLTNAQNGIEAGHRVLKNHGDAFAAVNVAHFDLRHFKQVNTVHGNAAGLDNAGLFRQKAQNGKRCRRLARACLADNADGFAGIEVKRNAVDCVNGLFVGLINDLQVFYFKQFFAHVLFVLSVIE